MNEMKKKELAECLVVSTDWLDSALTEFGLHLVTDADKRVLDAMGALRLSRCAGHVVIDGSAPERARLVDAVLEAELARRGENPLAGVRALDWLKELDDESGEKA